VNDDRLSRYLADQAEAIALPPADAGEVMRRGNRRRTRRRAGLVGAVAIVGVLATTVALRDDGDQELKANVANAPVVPSAFDWSIVHPVSGLGYSSSTARLSNGAVYGLSTAPGPADDKAAATPPHLYRSTDGAEWVHADLPEDLTASALAASGDTLYALGTAPAGGGLRDVVVKASDDGASTWRSVQLPSDITELQARHPGQISFGAPQIAAHDATHLVATIAVTANLDLSKYRPDLVSNDTTYDWTDTGVTIRKQPPPCAGFEDGATVPPSKDQAEACRADKRSGEVLGTYTFDQIGMDAELQALRDGRTYAYASDDGHTFQPVDLPAEARSGWAARVLGGADGYDMVVSHTSKETGSTSSLLHSTDGHAWTVATTLAGSPADAGYLGDHLAVALYTDDGGYVVKVAQPGGAWRDLRLTDAVPAPADGQVDEAGRTVNKPQQPWVGSLDFGPLGLAASVGTTDAQGRSVEYVVHTTDGSSLDVLKVADAAPHAGSIIGLSVTADAIAVRLNDGVPSKGQPPEQVVLVGTPR